MGLDSFWSKDKETVHLEFDPPLNLCGGLFSGNGNGSFRGKVYSELIEWATGESLYQERIPNETVKDMARKLNGIEFQEFLNMDYYCSEEQWADLQRMFKAYADAGADLLGWW